MQGVTYQDAPEVKIAKKDIYSAQKEAVAAVAESEALATTVGAPGRRRITDLQGVHRSPIAPAAAAAAPCSKAPLAFLRCFVDIVHASSAASHPPPPSPSAPLSRPSPAVVDAEGLLQPLDSLDASIPLFLSGAVLSETAPAAEKGASKAPPPPRLERIEIKAWAVGGEKEASGAAFVTVETALATYVVAKPAAAYKKIHQPALNRAVVLREVRTAD